VTSVPRQRRPPTPPTHPGASPDPPWRAGAREPPMSRRVPVNVVTARAVVDLHLAVPDPAGAGRTRNQAGSLTEPAVPRSLDASACGPSPPREARWHHRSGSPPLVTMDGPVPGGRRHHTCPWGVHGRGATDGPGERSVVAVRPRPQERLPGPTAGPHERETDPDGSPAATARTGAHLTTSATALSLPGED